MTLLTFLAGAATGAIAVLFLIAIIYVREEWA